MSEKKLPKTQLRALKFLSRNPAADGLTLHKASKSRTSPGYISRQLERKELISENKGKYEITERGLEKLKEESSMSYEMEQWEF